MNATTILTLTACEKSDTMPIIKTRSNLIRSVRHICRLQEPNRDALVHYARFIEDSVVDVLTT
jgi:hypothetical protein